MLPKVLSDNLCLFKPAADRLAYSVIFRMNKDGTRDKKT